VAGGPGNPAGYPAAVGRGLRAAALVSLAVALAACAARPAPDGQRAAAVPSAAPTATVAPTVEPTPVPTVAPTPPPPPTPVPAPAARMFALGAAGSVTVTDAGASSTITVTLSGLPAVAHAVHLHAGCTGNPNAHVAVIGTVGSAGTVSLSVPRRVLGSTVIVYPNASATGNPILCGATA
jgi:Cu/Zn superoxide dismutase